MRNRHTTPHLRSVLATLSVLLAFGSSPLFGADRHVVLSGIVVDDKGAPVAAAEVLVLPWAAPDVVDRAGRLKLLVRVKTDDGGRFSVSEDALFGRDTPPDCHVRLWAEMGRRTSNRRVVLLDAAEAKTLRLTLRRALVTAITVEEEDGDAVGGVDVDLSLEETGDDSDDAMGSHFRISVTTDEKGAAHPSGLPEGTYGAVQALVNHHARPVRVSGEQIALQREDDSLRVTITLPRFLRVVGRLLESDGRPARGLQVVDWSTAMEEAPLSRMVQSDTSGLFVLPHVAMSASELVVCSESDGESAGTPFAWPRVVAVRPLALSSEGDEFNVGEIRLPERRTVRVKIVDVDERPIPCRATVRRTDVGFGSASVEVEDSGWLTYRDVSREDNYVLEVDASSPRWGPIEHRFSLASDKDELTVRVTGAGMLIVRFFSSTPPRRRVALDSPTVVWFGRNPSSTTEMAVVDEVRMWAGTGVVGRLELRTQGRPIATCDTVSVAEDEPTVVEIAVPGM